MFHDVALNMKYIIQEPHVCAWIGEDKDGCRHPTIHGKAYCETHYARMYIVLLPEMADYIIEKELTSISARKIS